MRAPRPSVRAIPNTMSGVTVCAVSGTIRATDSSPRPVRSWSDSATVQARKDELGVGRLRQLAHRSRACCRSTPKMDTWGCAARRAGPERAEHGESRRPLPVAGVPAEPDGHRGGRLSPSPDQNRTDCERGGRSASNAAASTPVPSRNTSAPTRVRVGAGSVAAPAHRVTPRRQPRAFRAQMWLPSPRAITRPAGRGVLRPCSPRVTWRSIRPIDHESDSRAGVQAPISPSSKSNVGKQWPA